MDVSDFLYGSGSGNNNGRVNHGDDAERRAASTSYGLYAGCGGRADGDMRDSLRELDLTDSALARVFFSGDNVDVLQEGLRHGVYKSSGRERLIVGRQSDVELGIIMRSKYQSHARNASGGVREQVAELNARVLDYCVPNVLSEARMHKTYVRNLETLPTPMERGQIASSKGTRVNVITRF